MNGPATLHVLEGALQGQVLTLTEPGTSIGRDATNTLPLQGYSKVSRQHAQLAANNGTWSIQDCGSSNGTFVNGLRVTTAFLKEGDVLKLGDFVARLSLGNPAGGVLTRPTLTTISPPQQPQIYPYPIPPPHAPAQNNYFIAQSPPKNPGLAAVLSFFWPGLGQFYNGDMGKGVLFLLSYAVLVFTCIFFLFAIPVWIIGIVDAYQSAERINHEHARRPQG